MRKSIHRPNQTWQATVLISFYVAAFTRFETLKSRIKEILKFEQISLELEFLCEQVDLASLFVDRPVLPKVPIDLKSRNGDSIGRADKPNDAETLGGWIMLRFANPPKQIQCFLTCDHVVAVRDSGDSPVLDTAAMDYTTPESKYKRSPWKQQCAGRCKTCKPQKAVMQAMVSQYQTHPSGTYHARV